MALVYAIHIAEQQRTTAREVLVFMTSATTHPGYIDGAHHFSTLGNPLCPGVRSDFVAEKVVKLVTLVADPSWRSYVPSAQWSGLPAAVS